MMSIRKVAILMLVLTTILGNEVIGSDGLICGMEEEGVLSCRPSVSGRHPTPPSRLCCATVAFVNVKCICLYKDALPAIGADPKLVMALPQKCKLPIRIRC
ncbi:hypothetical protein ACHQM5_000204 [Ranunculus cassubicifolius]